MFLRLLVSFYFAIVATVLGCLSVAQSIQYQDAHLTRRQDGDITSGVSVFPNANYKGKAVTRAAASEDNPFPLEYTGSLRMSGDIWAKLTSPSSNSDNTTIIILWNSAPDISALSLPPGMAMTDIQSDVCSSLPCASGGTCSQFSPICKCSDGFSGAQCQNCAKNHFGPECQPCPSNCTNCDDGIHGSGHCLNSITQAKPIDSPTDCKCTNGECDDNGGCKCLPGWGPSKNGTACAQCDPGYYKTRTGSCQVCQIGCTSCIDITGICTNCQAPFTLDTFNQQKCYQSTNITGPSPGCPDGSYPSGISSPPCLPCSKVCSKCSGPLSTECTACASELGRYFDKDGNCVQAGPNGICPGTDGGIGDKNKGRCETCGAVDRNCMSCEYSNLSSSSTIKNAKCTRCLSNFMVSDGKCVKTCPPNTFSNSTNCMKCSPPCASCGETPDICLTCTKGFASDGKCVKSCPKGQIASNGTCVGCHPDCKTCNGPSYNQCTSCFQKRPALTDGHCLPTCKKTQYFDTTTSKCKECGSKCSSCFGPENCLSCNIANEIVINGACSPVPQLVAPST